MASDDTEIKRVAFTFEGFGTVYMPVSLEIQRQMEEGTFENLTVCKFFPVANIDHILIERSRII